MAAGSATALRARARSPPAAAGSSLIPNCRPMRSWPMCARRAAPCRRSGRKSCRTAISPTSMPIWRRGRSRRPPRTFRCSTTSSAIGYTCAGIARGLRGDTTMSGKGLMRLGAFFNPTGHHVASWRHPRAQADAGINFQHYLDITRTAERGKFDMVFLADNLGVRQAHMEALRRSAQYIANFEPLTLLSALATHTTHIGLVATASTSYNEPFHVARKFASLDHLSGGRAGWNLVTSGQENEARNFSREKHYEHGERYDRAREFARVVLGLWDTWDDDAFVRDKETGQFFHPEKLHNLNHRGEHFSVLGALNIPRSPQGHPVIVQAGGSDDMIAVAAEFAEVIFCAPLTLEAAQSFYATLKGRLAAYGRTPDAMKIMPGLSCVIGRTDAEAEDNYEKLNALIHPIVAREILSMVLG